MKRLRANTLKDHCNFLLHFGLSAGIAAGTFAGLGFPPIISVLAIGATAAIHLGLQPRVKRAFQEAIDEEKSDGSGKQIIDSDRLFRDMRFKRRFDLKDYMEFQPSLTPKIQGWVNGFAGKLGMKQTPDVAILDNSPKLFERETSGKKTLKDALRVMIREKFNQTANAFAFRHTYGNVVLNAPIIEGLNARELKGVVAHEVGHLAAGHNGKQSSMAFVATAAKFLTGLNMLVTTYSSLRNVGYHFLGNAVGMFAEGLVSKFAGWSEENPQDKKKIENLRSVFKTAAVAGIGIVGGAPDLAIAVGLDLATKTSLNLISKHYSRCNEFQADRIAAELTGDPQGMQQGLRTVADMHKAKHPLLFLLEDEAPKKISPVFDRIKDLDKTHPSIERRCAALQKIDQRVEYLYA